MSEDVKQHFNAVKMTALWLHCRLSVEPSLSPLSPMALVAESACPQLLHQHDQAIKQASNETRFCGLEKTPMKCSALGGSKVENDRIHAIDGLPAVDVNVCCL